MQLVTSFMVIYILQFFKKSHLLIFCVTRQDGDLVVIHTGEVVLAKVRDHLKEVPAVPQGQMVRNETWVFAPSEVVSYT